MSPDPLLASARLEDPQTWNRYVYARNNPLRFTDPEGLYASPSYRCEVDPETGMEIEGSCLNAEQRRILENSKIGDRSGEALYNSLRPEQQNAFVNITDKLGSIILADGSTALSQVSSVFNFDLDRIHANVTSSLASSLGHTDQFTTVPGHKGFDAVSFKETGVTFGNVQLSFDQAHAAADIDIDIGNIASRTFFPFGAILGGGVHIFGEVIPNAVFDTKTDQDTVRRLLLRNPNVQTITPSPDRRFNRP